MKIIILSKDSKERKFYFPTTFVKSKFVWRRIFKVNMSDEIYKEIKKAYKALKDYTNKNGHFVLIEVETGDDYIQIIV